MALPTWEVDLDVFGPVTVNRSAHLREPKGFNLPIPFSSDIQFRSINGGVQVTLTAYASTLQNARKLGLVFIGHMLDALTLQINLPLHLSFTLGRETRNNYTERRIITNEEWHDAFREARLLALAEPTFLRALGWYRKGLYSEDALDSFLAYWNAIEIVAGKYHPDNDEAKKGSKSQTWACFKLIWGDCEKWPNIPGQTKWIDDNYDTRKNIAHGTSPITIEFVEGVIQRLPSIHDVAYQFLSDWRIQQLNPVVPPEHKHLLGY